MGDGPAILNATAAWLIDSVKEAAGAELKVAERAVGAEEPAIILARADAWPEVARDAGFRSQAFDAYAIIVQPKRLFLLGRSEAAVRHAVADVLHGWGLRFYAPSPRWHIVPSVERLSVDRTRLDAPAMLTRKIWYAYGHGSADLKRLTEDHRRWVIGNRLSDVNLTQSGHAYGNIILRNEKAFTEHPEYYALLPDGMRDAKRAVAAQVLHEQPWLVSIGRRRPPKTVRGAASRQIRPRTWYRSILRTAKEPVSVRKCAK